MRPAHLALFVLAAANVALAGVGWARARPVTYVFTPLVDVVPGAVDGPEASALAADAKHRLDARDIQDAYARLGSTMSLDDLLRGVEALDDLTPAQREDLERILTDAKADRDALIALQREILGLEATLATHAAALTRAAP